MFLGDDHDDFLHGGKPGKAFQAVLQDWLPAELQELLGKRSSESPPSPSGGEDDTNVRVSSACQSTQ
jgi:hypothetical protein